MDAKKILLKRVSDLIDLADETIGAAGSDLFNSHKVSFRTQSLSFIMSLNGTGHPNYIEFEKASRFFGMSNVQNSKELLEGIKQDIENDYYLLSIKGLVSAEIFSDYLEMAEYLLSESYDTPAAVIAGSTLEEHLRKLCQNNGVAIDRLDNKGKNQQKAAYDLNVDLNKHSVYNNIEKGIVEGWIRIRNAAAHGKRSEYTSDQVKLMLQGVKEFIARNPL